MPKDTPSPENNREALERIENILRHIENVRDNCIVIGKTLIGEGQVALGKQIIAQGLRHDVSKMFGIEWAALNEEVPKARLEIAVEHHNTSPENRHHPEAWPEGISEMPRAFLAEMVADWVARSAEFGTSVRDWVDDGAAKRFGYKKGDKVYRELIEFVDMLCDKPFKQK